MGWGLGYAVGGDPRLDCRSGAVAHSNLFTAAMHFPDPKHQDWPRSNPAQILLVEDDAAVRDSLHCALESAGLAVCPSPGGRAAVQCFATAPFDLVIVDAGLGDRPDNVPWRALQSIRPDQPHIVLTVHGLDATAAAFPNALAVREKPVSMVELCRLLRRLLDVGRPMTAQ